MRKRWLLCLVALSIVGCRSEQDIREFSLMSVRMPDGTPIKAESLTDPVDMARGAMFREAMAKDHGLLYQYGKPGTFTYWMYQTNIPLDTIWMDSNRRVVELVANMPPCKSKTASECPRYGGHEQAMFVLQVPGGMAQAYGVQVGSVLTF